MTKVAILATLLIMSSHTQQINSFAFPGSISNTRTFALKTTSHKNAASLNVSSKSPKAPMKMTSGNERDDEIARLKAQAAKLRAEAAALEAEKASAMARAAEKAFDSFDTNKDGTVCVAELKAGLEKTFKIELSDSRARELMKAFDESGDNLLQPQEFVTLDRFKNKLNELVQEERELARKAQKDAEAEAEAARLAEARLELLNDAPPTVTDRMVSLIPYLFPLMDGLQYGRFLLLQTDEGNPVVTVLAILYALYRSIPFSGFVAFLALNFLSFNPRINRLVRFNMQQAIFVDIALLFPGLLLGISTTVLPALGVTIDPTFSEVSSDVVFFTLLVTLAYCIISSALGITPDKLPLISGAVDQRMPSIDMFDDQGRFVGPSEDSKDDKKKDSK